MTKLTGNKAMSKEVRGMEDYQSPPIILESLMRYTALPASVWEPAAGIGNLVTVLRNSGRLCYATDLNPAYAAIHGHMPVSFLEAEMPQTPSPPRAIVTNPPFSLLGQFAERAMGMGMEAYLFGRLNFMEGGERERLRDVILEARGGLNWVYVFRERVRDLHRTDYEGPKSSPQMTLAWFHWKPGFKGNAKIRRISQMKTGPLLPPPGPKGDRKRCRETIEMFEMEEGACLSARQS